MLGKHMHKLLSIASLVGALTLAGCPGPAPMPDGGADMTGLPVDMTTPMVDMACDPATGGCPPVDMAKPPGDMANTGDMAGPRDMTTPPTDMTTPPADMTGPRDMTTPPTDMTTPPTDMTTPPTDMIMTPADMTMTPTDMTMPPRDMAMPPTDGGMMGGGIGAACTSDTGCSAGPMPKCWKANVLDNPSNPATPGGYCSSSCTADAQCGTGARCVDFGPGGKHCLASCNSATTCRKPGYACRFYETAGVCFPDTVFDCDPQATGSCTEAGTGKMGGCIRGAFENKGTCVAGCNVGAGTCSTGAGGAKRQCVYVDNTVSTYKDKWKGPLCLNSPASPVSPGGACTYSDDCTDGYQCDGASGTCKQLCVSGGTPACGMGMCADAFRTMPAGNPGICR